VLFQTDYDEIEILKSRWWRHHNCVIEKRYQNNVTKFFHFGPPNQNFSLRQCLSAV